MTSDRAALEELRVPWRALVVLADGRRARVLRNTGTPRHISFETELEMEQENPPTREQGTDRAGRYLGPDGVSRSAMEQTDWHQLQEQRFAAKLAEQLYQRVHSDGAGRIIVMAAPKILGALRGAFHPEVSERVIAEIPKDLTAVSSADLARRLVRAAFGNDADV
jgi:protein required for attachment to host cells